MLTIGAFEAKTQLSALLDRVETGEEIVITRHGKAIARLVPELLAGQSALAGAASRLKALRATATLDGQSWKELREEGRK